MMSLVDVCLTRCTVRFFLLLYFPDPSHLVLSVEFSAGHAAGTLQLCQTVCIFCHRAIKMPWFLYLTWLYLLCLLMAVVSVDITH